MLAMTAAQWVGIGIAAAGIAVLMLAAVLRP